MKFRWSLFSILVIATLAQEEFLTDKQLQMLIYVRNIVATHFSTADPVVVAFPIVEYQTHGHARSLRFNQSTENMNLLYSIIQTLTEKLDFTVVTVTPFNENKNNLDSISVNALQTILIAWPISRQPKSTFATLQQLSNHLIAQIAIRKSTNPEIDRHLIILTGITQEEMYFF